MRRFMVVLLAMLVMGGGCGATLTMRATAPTSLNDAVSCTVTPVLSSAPAGSACVVHFAWSGPSSGEDSVATTVGTPVTLTKTVQPGTYTIRGWASNTLGGAYAVGCDTTVTKIVGGPPARVADVR